MNIRPGDEVKCAITNFRGIAVCRSEWLHGCVRIGVQSPELKDGKPIPVEHFDEAQLEITKVAGQAKGPYPPVAAVGTGGPQSDDTRAGR